jgi:hypothetical protein
MLADPGFLDKLAGIVRLTAEGDRTGITKKSDELERSIACPSLAADARSAARSARPGVTAASAE